MKKVEFNFGQKYEAIVSRGVFKRADYYICRVSEADKAVIITGNNVDISYAESLKDSLQHSGVKTDIITIDTAHRKKLSLVSEIYETLTKSGVSDNGVVVSIGDAEVVEISACAASSYHRGLPLVLIPTTFEAQFEIAAGGKLYTDKRKTMSYAKLLGHIILVLDDPELFEKCDSDSINDCIAVGLKYGAFVSKELFELLEEEDAIEIIDYVLEECIQIKSDAVNDYWNGRKINGIFYRDANTADAIFREICNDEFDKHEMEIMSLLVSIKAGEKAGLTKGETLAHVKNVLDKYSFPTEIRSDVMKSFFEVIETPGNSLCLVIPEVVGKSSVYTIDSGAKVNGFLA